MTFNIVTTGNADPHQEKLPDLEAEGCRLIVLPPDAAWDEQRIAALAPIADCYVGRFGRIGLPRHVLERSTRLRGIVSPIIGVEHIDVAAATELGLVVAHGAMPENFDGMAEAGVMLIAALLKELPQKQAALAAGRWRPTPLGRMVQGATIGIVGLGRIGRGVVQRLAGWDARLIAYEKMKLDSWRDVPIWRDPARCQGDLSRSLVGNLEHPIISEAGRRLLASRLSMLSERQLIDLFTAARVERRGDTTRDASGARRPVRAADWVNAFKEKRDQIVKHTCPA